MRVIAMVRGNGISPVPRTDVTRFGPWIGSTGSFSLGVLNVSID